MTSKAGRIEGRKSGDGAAYELVQHGRVIQSYPIEVALDDTRLKAAIKRNGWQELS